MPERDCTQRLEPKKKSCHNYELSYIDRLFLFTASPALRPLQSALVGVAGVGRVAPRSFVFRSFDGSRLYCLVEQYTDKLLKDIHVIVYDEGKTAVEKIRAFIDATIISSENISAEGTELQKTVDLEENRYMIDKLSHKIIEKLTIYFERIINQGISEKTLFVKYPSETAEFLMTAYVFVSNNISIRYSKKESVNEYLNAFKIMLEQTLNAKKLFSN